MRLDVGGDCGGSWGGSVGEWLGAGLVCDGLFCGVWRLQIEGLLC